MKKYISQKNWLRQIVMPLLKATALDIKIRHHWVPVAKIRLNSFSHKGYWYHGMSREKRTLSLMKEIIQKNDTVLEIGGHIGYFSILYAYLVGPAGKVVVLEPGDNNLSYIRENIAQANGQLSHIELFEVAAGIEDGEAILYEDDLTGQNNSLVRGFAGLQANKKKAYVQSSVTERIVQVRSIDSLSISPSFVKIDVEGFEWSALQGGGRNDQKAFACCYGRGASE